MFILLRNTTEETAHWTEHQLEHFICDFVYHAVI